MTRTPPGPLRRCVVAERFITIPWRTQPTPCRGCGEEIYFVTDRRTRRPHPVSVAAKGCHAPVRSKVERDASTGTEITVVEPSDGRGVSHFTNCPRADRYRR